MRRLSKRLTNQKEIKEINDILTDIQKKRNKGVVCDYRWIYVIAIFICRRYVWLLLLRT